MSTTTVIFFVMSVGTFVILLVLAAALFLRNRHLNASAEAAVDRVAVQELGSSDSTSRRSYFCDTELVVLNDTVRIRNLHSKQMQLEANSAKSVLHLVKDDLWVQKIHPTEKNWYKVFALSGDSQFSQQVVDVTVSTAEISIKPIMASNSRVTIWRIKPVLLSGEKQLVERIVFNGTMQKTGNLDRLGGRMYKIRVTADGGKTKLAGANSMMESSSNIDFVPNQPVLTIKVDAKQVMASNKSNRGMEVAVTQGDSADDDGGVLKKKLGEAPQQMPLCGKFSFWILPDTCEELKDLLCLSIGRDFILVEPYTKFGSAPLICDVRCLPKLTSGGGGQSASPTTQIISGEVLSRLQLPRKSYSYILAFCMRPKYCSVGAAAAAAAERAAAAAVIEQREQQTSYTLQ